MPVGSLGRGCCWGRGGQGPIGARARQVQVLRVVGVVDERLARHDELEGVRVPARFFLHLAGRPAWESSQSST